MSYWPLISFFGGFALLYLGLSVIEWSIDLADDGRMSLSVLVERLGHGLLMAGIVAIFTPTLMCMV